jgi:hypothetical protein
MPTGNVVLILSFGPAIDVQAPGSTGPPERHT